MGKGPFRIEGNLGITNPPTRNGIKLLGIEIGKSLYLSLSIDLSLLPLPFPLGVNSDRILTSSRLDSRVFCPKYHDPVIETCRSRESIPMTLG